MVFRQLAGKKALPHSFVAKFFFGEVAFEGLVGGVEFVPHLQELFLLPAELLGMETAPKAADEVDLPGREVGEFVLDFLQGYEVGEQGPGVNEVFVDVVEVAEQHVAPEIEVVEPFVASGTGKVSFVKFDNQCQVVGLFQVGLALDEFSQGEDFRHPQGTVGQRGQFPGEEQTGPFVRK